jgi:hypothetical protein
MSLSTSRQNINLNLSGPSLSAPGNDSNPNPNPGPVTSRLLETLGCKSTPGGNQATIVENNENFDINNSNNNNNNNNHNKNNNNYINYNNNNTRVMSTLTSSKEKDFKAGDAGVSSNNSALVSVIPADFVRIEGNNTDSSVYPISDWQSHRAKDSSKPYYILASFGVGGIKIDCPSSTEYVELICHGVSSCRVMFSKESITSAEEKIENIIIYKEDRTADTQTIRIKAPWPSKSIDILFIDRYDAFISIFNVFLYTAHIRSSSMSTPIQKKENSKRYGY